MAPKKEKPQEYGTSGLDFQTWFPLNSESDTLQLRKWEFWESLRRNKKYRKLCEGIEFLPTGTVSPRWLNPLENRSLIAERQGRVFELFGVESIMDPTRRYDELPPGAVETWGVTPDAVTLIAPHIRPGQTFPDADSYKKRFIDEGRFIALRIDITQWDSEISQKAERFISEQRALAGIPTPNTRTRFIAAIKAFQVYDLKEAGKTPTEIIKELWPDEFKKAEVSMGPSDYAFNKKYEMLSQKYKKAGDKDWHEKACKEADRIASGSGISILTLCQRVEDKYQSAKNRIEGVAQK